MRYYRMRLSGDTYLPIASLFGDTPKENAANTHGERPREPPSQMPLPRVASVANRLLKANSH